MSCEENQPLLPKIVLEDETVQESSVNKRNDSKNYGSTVIIGVVSTIACFTLIATCSSVPFSGVFPVTELRLLPSHVGKSHAGSLNTDALGNNFVNERDDKDQIYCDEQGFGECVNRVLGICTEHGPCVTAPVMEPTGTPTSPPSNIYISNNCDPHNPPCAEWFLGVCTKHYHCHEVKEPCGDNADDDDAAHTRNEDCDPESPPCVPGETFLGICWKYQVDKVPLTYFVTLCLRLCLSSHTLYLHSH